MISRPQVQSNFSLWQILDTTKLVGSFFPTKKMNEKRNYTIGGFFGYKLLEREGNKKTCNFCSQLSWAIKVALDQSDSLESL